jgi:hypothetical protein
MTIQQDEWLKHIGREYLDSFIPGGGCAVKFVIPRQDDEELITHLSREGSSRNYLVTFVSAAETKIHLIDQLFFAVARQIDWESLAAQVRLMAITQSAYVLPGPSTPVTFASLGTMNAVAQQQVRLTLQQWFTEKVFRDFQMTQEFRQAMSILCLEPLRSPDPGPGSIYQTVLDWLKGEARLLSAIKPALIYQKIARHNARDMFVSLAHWAQVTGRPGLQIVLDFRATAGKSRAMVAPNTPFYTKPMLLDFYEVMRQFIDSTDDMEGLFLVAIGPREFLEDEDRGLRKYRALEMRVAEEIRDKTHDNPLATLARIS